MVSQTCDDIQIHRGRVLQIVGDEVLLHENAALVVSKAVVRAVLPWANAAREFGGASVVDHGNCVLAPGFVDLHIHGPQVDVIASPADGLLDWLERHTFPQEAKFADQNHADEAANFFVAELVRNGVTTPLIFGSSHVASVEALFSHAQQRNMRAIVGKCLMDRYCPDGVRDDIDQGLADTEALIRRWHGVGRLGYAITPRFACTSSVDQLRGAGELGAKYPSVWVQSHVSENLDEIAWARELFPDSASYLGTYGDFGLLRPRSIYAHCIHFDDADRALMRECGAAAAVCPTSNQFLGSGNFDFAAAQSQGIAHGLASDVGGGMSFSPFATMRAAYTVARAATVSHVQSKMPTTLSAKRLWWLHTLGAARCLGLDDKIGSLQMGTDADFVVIDPKATPLLERRTNQANGVESLLFALLMLADDRAIKRTYIAGFAQA